MAVRNKVVVGVTAAGVATTGYVALRLFIRSKVYDALVDEYDYPSLRTKVEMFSEAFGINANLPTASEFAESLVPVFSVVTPYAAIEDVLRNGRRSAYWPDNRRKTPKGGEKVEDLLFKALQAAYYTPEGASNKQMFAAAGGALAEEALGKGLEYIEGGGKKK